MPDMISVKIEDKQVIDYLKLLEKKAGDMSSIFTLTVFQKSLD